MKKHIIVFAFLFPFLLLNNSCKKAAGTGGRASIKGKIWVRQYKSIDFSTPLFAQYEGTNQTVHIIYGDNLGEDNHATTDYNGSFEFQYLRKGNYKVYVYSADSAVCSTQGANALYVPQKEIVQDVNITDRKQILDLGTITILKNK